MLCKLLLFVSVFVLIYCCAICRFASFSGATTTRDILFFMCPFVSLSYLCCTSYCARVFVFGVFFFFFFFFLYKLVLFVFFLILFSSVARVNLFVSVLCVICVAQSVHLTWHFLFSCVFYSLELWPDKKVSHQHT